MVSTTVLLVIQLALCAVSLFFGHLGTRLKYLSKDWPHRLMWLCYFLSLIPCGIILSRTLA